MWEELGIEPTFDAKAIRRAYAERLKSIAANADIAAFQRLRRAYEMALAIAARKEALPAGGVSDAKPPFTRTGQPKRSSIGAEPIQASTLRSGMPSALSDLAPEVNRFLEALGRALEERDSRRALALLDEGMSKAFLPLRPEQPVIDRLAELLAEDQTLPAETFRRLAGSLGGGAAIGRSAAAPSTPLARAIARLEAAGWYARLLTRAQQRGFGPGRRDRAVARIMLGQSRWWQWTADLWTLRCLQTELAELDRHAPWLRPRIDPAFVEDLRFQVAHWIYRSEHPWPIDVIRDLWRSYVGKPPRR